MTSSILVGWARIAQSSSCDNAALIFLVGPREFHAEHRTDFRQQRARDPATKRTRPRMVQEGEWNPAKFQGGHEKAGVRDNEDHSE